MEGEASYCYRVVGQHLREVGEGFRVEPTNGDCRILTPYVLPDNDGIELTVRRRDGRLTVSDEGSTLGFLFLNGIDLSPHSRAESFLRLQLRRFGLRAAEGEVVADTAESEVGDAVTRVIEASKAIAYIVYTFRGRSGGEFKGEVAEWLDENDIRCEVDTPVEGASGRHFTIDFLRRRPANPPVYIKALHSETRGYAKAVTFATVALWADLGKKAKSFESVSLLDDGVEQIWEEQVSLLKTHSDRVGFWSTREELLPILA